MVANGLCSLGTHLPLIRSKSELLFFRTLISKGFWLLRLGKTVGKASLVSVYSIPSAASSLWKARNL